MTAAALWNRRIERGERGKEREMILVYRGLYPSKQPRLPQPAIVGVNWRSQSTSWVLSVFACHLVRCGGAEAKRNECSTAHITGGSLGLSASVSRIPKAKKKRKKRKKQLPQKRKSSSDRGKKDLPYALTGDCALFVVPQTSEGIDFLDMVRQILPRYLFQVSVWGVCAETFPLLHYFQHTKRAASFAVKHTKLHTVSSAFPLFFHPLHLINRSFIQRDLFFELLFHCSLQDLPSIPPYVWLLFPYTKLLHLSAALLHTVGERQLRWDTCATFHSKMFSSPQVTTPSSPFLALVFHLFFSSFERHEPQREL